MPAVGVDFKRRHENHLGYPNRKRATGTNTRRNELRFSERTHAKRKRRFCGRGALYRLFGVSHGP